ncbi:MAG TPA: hypothetical protein VIM11_24115 [Tepidisphaeraceae bacterium]|jgi:hypothetical protein
MYSQRPAASSFLSIGFGSAAAALLLCLLNPAGPVARAGIVLIGQDRFTDIVSDDGRNQHQGATDFGPFNSNIELNGIGAFQQSTLTVTPDGTGAEFKALLITGHGLGVPESLFLVNFAITSSAVPFSVTYSSLTASEAGPSAGPTGSFTGFNAPGTLVNGDALSGKLEMGQYAIQADANNFAGTIELDLKVGTSVVPLPPALWAVAAFLPPMLLAARILRRAKR